MTTVRAAVTAAAMSVLAGCAGASTPSLSLAPSPGHGSATPRAAFVRLDPLGYPLARHEPRLLWLTGGRVFLLRQIEWVVYDRKRAIAIGMAAEGGCTPSCASAPVHHFRMRLIASQPRTLTGYCVFTRYVTQRRSADGKWRRHERWILDRNLRKARRPVHC